MKEYYVIFIINYILDALNYFINYLLYISWRFLDFALL